MNGREKSDLPIVAGKLANGAVQAAEEPVERRGGAKENADPQNTVRTQSREAVSRVQARIRGAVTTVPRQTSEVGARCGSTARRDLCGGRLAMVVPTATPLR